MSVLVGFLFHKLTMSLLTTKVGVKNLNSDFFIVIVAIISCFCVGNHCLKSVHFSEPLFGSTTCIPIVKGFWKSEISDGFVCNVLQFL